MIRNRKVYILLTIMMAICFVLGNSVTGSIADNPSSLKKIKLTPVGKKGSDYKGAKNLYGIIKGDGKLFGKATKVKDPVTGDPLEGRCTLEYVCLLDALAPSLSAPVILAGGVSDKWEFACNTLDSLKLAESAEGLPVTLNCP